MSKHVTKAQAKGAATILKRYASQQTKAGIKTAAKKIWSKIKKKK